MNRNSSRPEFLIKALPGSTGSGFRTTRDQMPYPSISKFSAETKIKPLSEREEMELGIHNLQERCIKAAQGIEAQKEKEHFYDNEIARLNRLIESTRLKKIDKMKDKTELRNDTIYTMDGIQGKSIEHSVSYPSGFNSKLQKIKSGINETKAKNSQLRENLNDLR